MKLPQHLMNKFMKNWLRIERNNAVADFPTTKVLTPEGDPPFN